MLFTTAVVGRWEDITAIGIHRARAIVRINFLVRSLSALGRRMPKMRANVAPSTVTNRPWYDGRGTNKERQGYGTVQWYMGGALILNQQPSRTSNHLQFLTPYVFFMLYTQYKMECNKLLHSGPEVLHDNVAVAVFSTHYTRVQGLQKAQVLYPLYFQTCLNCHYRNVLVSVLDDVHIHE
ncbi:hypothetical protein VTP01DRAFT_5783 [Rhizomucor pusillus]|uniref:uncharacterized protein n=1 Tax=Rhizomucor pusillus TaxID=4840 RepID=UPI00374483DB